MRLKHQSSLVVAGLALMGWATIGCTADAKPYAPEGSQPPNTSGPKDPPGTSDPTIDPGEIPPVNGGEVSNLECRPDIVVEPNSRALIVTDPEVLERFGLERVLQQLVNNSPNWVTPLQLVRSLFDTENAKANGVFPDVVHCDDAENIAFGEAPAKFCPRAEGKLAMKTGFFTPGDPDYFYPVALVNRFDLAPRLGTQCGEYRIIYAKWSGRTNPNERVFLAFESILGNPVNFDTVVGCRSVAEMWAGLAHESDVKVVADRLEEFYFSGIPGFAPVVMPEHFSMDHQASDDDGGGYGDPGTGPQARRGQVRVSQGMQDPWEFREFHLRFSLTGEPRPPLFFAPVTTKNNPRPELFDPASSVVDGPAFRAQFLERLPILAEKQAFKIQFSPRMPTWNAGESMISSDPSVDFASVAFAGEPGQTFWSQIQSAMVKQQIGTDCPADDPLLPEHLVQRVSMVSCAGCHAPEQYLGSSHKMGCGQTWPRVANRAHIDEFGKLSEALTNSILPRRAEILSNYLQACDIAAIRESLEPAETGIGGGGGGQLPPL